MLPLLSVERPRSSSPPARASSRGGAPFEEGALVRVTRAVRRGLRAIDPNDDPTAEPLSPVALLALLVLSGVSVYLFLRWKIQPMQDFGHHVAMTAVVTDYAREGSIYPAIYKPFDYLNTNSLLYSVAGLTGKVIGPSWAIRIWAASYLGLVPLATLYAHRVFGRSAWGAVMAVPLAYDMSYVFGFANFLFAAPLAILALPLFYRMLVAPSWRRVLAVSVLLALLFLAHVHVFMWTGALLITMTLIAFVVALHGHLLGSPRMPRTSALKIALLSLLSVLPAMGLFARWMIRSREGTAPDEMSLIGMNPVTWEGFKAAIPSQAQLLSQLHNLTVIVRGDERASFVVWALLVGLASVAIARLRSWRRPPVMELAAMLSLGSYFFLPEDAGGQAVIGSRQVDIALWFAPAFFVPVTARETKLGRWFVVAAVCALASMHLTTWSKQLARFQADEVFGFEEVLAAAPPRKRMHYVNHRPQSRYFPLNAFWHVEKWYMADALGQCNENPAWGGMNSIRYRKSYDFHRPTNHQASWVSMDEIWDNFDVILTHHWEPSPAQLAIAQERGELLAKKGTWELWRSRDAHPK